MVKLVEFTRDMRPFQAGDRRAMPDDLAAKAIETGVGKIIESVFDRVTAQPLPPKRYVTRRKRA